MTADTLRDRLHDDSARLRYRMTESFSDSGRPTPARPLVGVVGSGLDPRGRKAAILLLDLLQLHAEQHPERIALSVVDGEELSFGDWARYSHRLACHLLDWVVPGQTVLLLFSSEEWVQNAIAFVGVLSTGAVAVPLSPTLSSPEIARLAEDCGASKALAGRVMPDLLLPAVDVRYLDSMSSELNGTEEPLCCLPTLAPGDPACVVYTSGTVGVPKGVVCSHAGLTFGLSTAQAPALAGNLCLHSYPTGTGASLWLLIEPLRLNGFHVICMAEFNPERFAELVSRLPIVGVHLSPAMARAFLRARTDPCPSKSLRFIALGTAPAPDALLDALSQAYPGTRILNTYGCTEAAGASTVAVFGIDPPNSLGRASPDRVRIVDADLRPLPPGQVGEVLLKNAAAPKRHYLNHSPESTELSVDGWTRTGDLGYVDHLDYLFIVDRIKDIVNCGGWKISTLLVESALLEHPHVLDAAVVGVPHEVLGEVVAGVVVGDGGLDVPNLRSFAASLLAEHEQPRVILEVDSLPRNEAGKVLKDVLRQTIADRAEPPWLSPLSETEQWLLSWCRQTLQLDAISMGDNFIELGGHSILAAQLAASVATELRREIDIPKLLVADSLREIAAAIDLGEPTDEGSREITTFSAESAMERGP